MRKKRLVVASLIVMLSVLVLGGLGVGLLGAAWLGVWRSGGPGTPLAPSAPKAPKWNPKKAIAEEPTPGETKKASDESPEPPQPPEPPRPAYGLPLEIVVEDVPEVPEEIRGPSPPIDEE